MMALGPRRRRLLVRLLGWLFMLLCAGIAVLFVVMFWTESETVAKVWITDCVAAAAVYALGWEVANR